jgi:hypothetical protein
VALGEVDECCELGEGGFGLDSFGDDFEAEPVCECDRRADDCLGVGVDVESGEE